MSVLADLLRFRADERPEHTAFADQRRALTYVELTERATARAAALRRGGVNPGDRVVIAMSAGLELIETFWSLQLLGAAPVIFSPSVPAATLARRAAIVRPRMVITDSSSDIVDGSRDERATVLAGPDAVAFLQLTSGSTGEPRASLLLHRNILAHLHSARWSQYMDADEVFVSWVPPWHDMGLVCFVIGAVYHGASCHLVEPAIRTIPEWLRTITRVSGTMSAAPDFAFRIAAHLIDPDTVDVRSLRFLLNGGEPVRWSTVQRFGQRFGVLDQIAPGYGLGEATLSVSMHLPGESIAVDERGNVACGAADDGLEVRAGTSADEPGEVVVRGPQVFAGYFEAPDETRRALRDGWLHTGDLGYLDDDGRLFVLGRREGMIKRAGAVISPRELEEAASSVPGIRAAGAVSLSVPGRTDELIAVAVEPGRDCLRGHPDLVAEVSAAVHRVVGFQCQQVSVLSKLPRTENGKIRYAALRSQLSQALSVSTSRN